MPAQGPDVGVNWSEALASTLAAQPIGYALAASLALAFLWIVSSRLLKRLRKPANTLDGLVKSEEFDALLDEVSAREFDNRRAGRRRNAVIHGRVDHLQHVGQIWGPETRSEAIDEVARIIRAGVRRTDAVWPAGDGSYAETLVANTGEAAQPGGFIVQAHGADESDASAIAKRLIGRLAERPVHDSARDIRLSASFGVAEQREGEDAGSLYSRADAALSAAQDSGEQEVVAASEWEEIKALRSPAASEATDSKIGTGGAG
ncbi:MAG: hypothetical protein AAF697_04910 [Pseudomonadota bacterium]